MTRMVSRGAIEDEATVGADGDDRPRGLPAVRVHKLGHAIDGDLSSWPDPVEHGRRLVGAADGARNRERHPTSMNWTSTGRGDRAVATRSSDRGFVF
jgi:hypothetical protein